MPANKNTKVYLALTALVIVAVSILTFFVIRGFDNIKNAPSNLVTQNELSQFPVDYVESNTLIVVCPEEARNNSDYPDPACKETTYFGTEGIYEAINKGGKEHTIYLKNGRYRGPIYINNEKRYLTIAGESRDGVIFYRDFFYDTYQDQPIISIDGDGGYTIDNITVTAPADLLEYDKYSSIGISIGRFSAATIKNVLIYNTSVGVYLYSDTQDVKIYKSLFVKNTNGVIASTSNEVELKNNIFAFNNNYGLVLDLDSYSIGSPESYPLSELAIGEIQYKILENNTFYNNRVGVRSNAILKTGMVNNIFSKNVDRDIEPTAQFAEDLENFYSDITRQELYIMFNFTDNNTSKFCSYYQKTLFGNYTTCKNFDQGPNKSNISSNIFVKTDVDAGDFNFRLSASSNLIDAGDPSSRDADGTRSDPGAYGGYCYYDSDGCDDLEFPIINSLPEIQPGTDGNFNPSNLDNNNDGEVDLLDIINLIKYVFGS